MSQELSRREFVGSAAALGFGTAILPLTGIQAQGDGFFRAPPMERVRVGFVGIGGQGSTHVENLLAIDGVDLTAVCDIRPDRVAWAQDKAVGAGQPKPKGYSNGPLDFERLCAEEELDLVEGDMIRVPPGTRHGFANLSGAPVELLVAFHPGGFEELFITHRTDQFPAPRPQGFAEDATRLFASEFETSAD